ncbi:hypothetical protein AaE_002029 [Aphanomyces astaci]|uniref:Uncharacterized protein n=2 Tax=Aphanomyces astaci TaxID=112090 RepID=A0A6A5AUS1_APHAT|nr:hypothetical protein AaE_002029 [Aphanomyces astaci]
MSRDSTNTFPSPPSTTLASSLSKFGPLKKSTILLLLEHEHVVAHVYKMAQERGVISDADVLQAIAKHTRPHDVQTSSSQGQAHTTPTRNFDALKTSTKLLLFDNEHVLAEVYEEAKRCGSISDEKVLAIIRLRSLPSSPSP